MGSSKTTCSLSVEFSLVKENILIQEERITQLYVIQSKKDPFKWFGVLFVDSGIYMGAVIRFTMTIGDTYPDCPCPKIIFEPIPCHPLVNPNTGELDTRNAFPDWNSSTHKLHQLLWFVKRVICQADIYIKQIKELIGHYHSDDLGTNVQLDHGGNSSIEGPSPQMRSTQDFARTASSKSIPAFNNDLIDRFDYFYDTLNCIRTYENNPEEFRRLVDEFKQKCYQNIFERPTVSGSDENALVFSSWNPHIHEPIRSCVLAGRFTPTSLFASYHKETDSVSFIPGSEPS